MWPLYEPPVFIKNTNAFFYYPKSQHVRSLYPPMDAKIGNNNCFFLCIGYFFTEHKFKGDGPFSIAEVNSFWIEKQNLVQIPTLVRALYELKGNYHRYAQSLESDDITQLNTWFDEVVPTGTVSLPWL
jgi:hypothetical protein